MTLRSIRVVAFVTRFLLATAPERRRLHKLAETDPAEASRIANERVGGALRRICEISGIEIITEGLDHIPEEACLFVGNHISYFDIVTTGAVIPGGAGYVAKDSLKKIPGLSDWMDLIHCLFLNRTDIKQGLKTILTGVDYIKSGYSMYIFPEGTRHPEGEMGEFKGGSLKMAQRAKAPIVPVAISGSRDIYENNPHMSIRPGTVRITFGRPFTFDDLPKEERKHAAEYTRELIIEMLKEQKAIS
ncbi:MAG: 1-acyl-sn-glycerol-3-phosphate acyltransferase [Eubacterium sp.]|nr:1-acyl-sn-glycerol-3-phosphate acyltransferase [Eubacterium sp.]